jgi:hypothetical protein
MSGVGLCDGEAEVALDPGQDRVPYPVRADLLSRFAKSGLDLALFGSPLLKVFSSMQQNICYAGDFQDQNEGNVPNA